MSGPEANGSPPSIASQGLQQAGGLVQNIMKPKPKTTSPAPDGHTTAGLDAAMQAHANQVHPVGGGSDSAATSSTPKPYVSTDL